MVEMQYSQSKSMYVEGGPLPLNVYQNYSWRSARKLGKKATSNVNMAYRLSGHLDIQRLVSAIDFVANKHDHLRSHYFDSSGIPFRRCLQTVQNVLTVSDISIDQSEFEGYLLRYSAEVFSLERDIPFKARLHRAPDEQHYLFLNFHHIAVDGWSLGLILEDIETGYNNPEDLSDDEKSAPFDFTSLGHQPTKIELDRQNKFWTDNLREVKKPILPSGVAETAGEARSEFDVIFPGSGVQAAVKTICQRLNITPYVIYTSLVASTLMDLCTTNDLLLSTSVSPRWSDKTQNLVAYFSALIPLRIKHSTNSPPLDRIRNVQTSIHATFPNLDIGYDELLSSAGLGSGLALHIGAAFPLEKLDLNGVESEHIQAPDLQSWAMMIWVPVSFEHCFIRTQRRSDVFSETDYSRFKLLLGNKIHEYFFSTPSGAEVDK